METSELLGNSTNWQVVNLGLGGLIAMHENHTNMAGKGDYL